MASPENPYQERLDQFSRQVGEGTAVSVVKAYHELLNVHITMSALKRSLIADVGLIVGITAVVSTDMGQAEFFYNVTSRLAQLR